MNIYALVFGIIVVTYVILRFKKTRLAKTKWAYPLFLASFPLYYFAFAIFGSDLITLGKETLVPIIFFLLAYLAYKSQRKLSALFVAISCLAHAGYDAYHDMFFLNTDTPDWWLEFCGSIDLILGIYLIYIALTLPVKNIKRDPQTA